MSLDQDETPSDVEQSSPPRQRRDGIRQRPQQMTGQHDITSVPFTVCWSSISLIGSGVRCDPDLGGTTASTNTRTAAGLIAAPMAGRKGPAPEWPITATGGVR